MGPGYLTGKRLSLRAPVKADADVAAAWYPGIFPVGAVRAEAYLKETVKTAWWPGRELLLVIERVVDGQVVGGVVVEHPTGPGAVVTLTLAPHLGPDDADATQSDTVRLLVPWLLHEAEVLTVTVEIGSDQPRSLTAAKDLGMETQIRLREFLARPGGRADLLQI